jgi:hypothetical protein
MLTMHEAAREFLAQKSIAVAGVSRSGAEAANAVYCKLRSLGYRVFAVNPNAATVEGDPCYPDLKSIPEAVDGVVIATRPEVAEQIVQQCADLGISRVWLHRSFGQGSVSPKAVAFCHAHGIMVIPGGCPRMYCEAADFGHKCMRWVLNVTGGLPRQI